MITYTHYRSGKVFGMKYVFKPGSILPAHVHTDELLHNIVVLKGQCIFFSEDRMRFLEAGEIFDFDGSKTHSIESRDGCEILSLFLNGEPESYKTLSEEDRSGVIP